MLRRWDLVALVALFGVLVGTPLAVFAGQRYLNNPPHEITIVAHIAEDGGFVPNRITVVQGEHVRLRLTSADVTHGFAIPALGIDAPELYPGRYVTVDFTPQKPGRYPFLCTIVCSPLHYKMNGEIIVLPAPGTSLSPTNEATPAKPAPTTASLPANQSTSTSPTPAPTSPPPPATGTSGRGQVAATATEVAGPAVSFRSDIQPIFQNQCVTCHTGRQAPGGLDLTSYQSLMHGASGTPVIVPGKPDQSLLVQKVKGTAGARMPFGGQPLPAKDIQRIEAWIAEGAPNN